MEHYFFKIEWIGFPKVKNRRIRGCYLIGDVYIGASVHIRKRILAHCSEVYSTIKKEFLKGFNDRDNIKHKYIYDCIVGNKPIRVKYIDSDVMNEKKLHDIYNIPYNSQTSFYTESVKNKYSKSYQNEI